MQIPPKWTTSKSRDHGTRIFQKGSKKGAFSVAFLQADDRPYGILFDKVVGAVSDLQKFWLVKSSGCLKGTVQAVKQLHALMSRMLYSNCLIVFYDKYFAFGVAVK